METHPLGGLCEAWRRVIAKAKDLKKEKFGNDAAECMRYFRANSAEVWDNTVIMGESGYIFSGQDEQPNIGPPSFRIVVAKAAEMVQLFGPHLYQTNPQRMVLPKSYEMPPPDALTLILQQQMGGMPLDPNDPMVQQLIQQQLMQWQTKLGQDNLHMGLVATMMEKVLNFTPGELDLEKNYRRVLDEALIKGMGMFVHEIDYRYPGSSGMVGSFYRSVDDLILDPEARQWDDLWWIAIQGLSPYWELEERYGLPPDSLKKYANSYGLESLHAASDAFSRDERADMRKRGETMDLIPYWEIYSRCGIGDRFKSVPEELRQRLRDANLGPYAHLVIADGVPYPLNLPTSKLTDPVTTDDDIFQAFQWPVPFWADKEWPITPLMFHEVPGEVWPMSHLKPGLAELRFINWAIGFLAAKVRTSSLTVLAMAKALDEDWFKTFLQGPDFSILKTEHRLLQGQSLGDLIQFIQAPPMNKDTFEVLAAVMEQFDRRVGLSELLYGQQTRQFRSATEADQASKYATIRIDDMRSLVNETSRKLARKEALMWRWVGTSRDVSPILGDGYAHVWDHTVASFDMDRIIREFDYQIEASTARRPNIETQLGSLMELSQLLVPVYQQLALGGQPQQWNAFVGQVAKLNLLPQHVIDGMMIPEPDPNQPDPQQQAMEMQQQIEQAKLQIEQQKAQLEMQLKQQEMENKRQLAALDLEKKAADAQFEARRRDAELAFQQQKWSAELQMQELQGRQQQANWERENQQDWATHHREMQQQREAAAVQTQTMKQLSDAKVKAAKQQAAAKPKPKEGEK